MGYLTWDDMGSGLGRVIEGLDPISFERGWDGIFVEHSKCQALAGISRGIV